MPSAESRALSAGLQMYSPSALQLGQYISRDTSKVVASASSIPTISALREYSPTGRSISGGRPSDTRPIATRSFLCSR